MAQGADRHSERRVVALRHEGEDAAARLPALLAEADRIAATVAQGVHGRRRSGIGETFWQYRHHRPEDGRAALDWRQSAKSDPVYVRETEWEAAQSVWLWRDGSPSMAFQSSTGFEMKRERADLLVLALTSLLVRGGERVALLGTGMTPASGRAVLNRLWTMIESGQTPSDSLPRPEFLPRFARVVMFGDFLTPLDQVAEVINGFAHRGLRGHLVQILDPAEERLPYLGRVLFDGPEQEGEVLISQVESLWNDYDAELANHRDGLRELCRRFGWSVITHRTDRSPEQVLMTLYLQLSETIKV